MCMLRRRARGKHAGVWRGVLAGVWRGGCKWSEGLLHASVGHSARAACLVGRSACVRSCGKRAGRCTPYRRSQPWTRWGLHATRRGHARCRQRRLPTWSHSALGAGWRVGGAHWIAGRHINGRRHHKGPPGTLRSTTKPRSGSNEMSSKSVQLAARSHAWAGESRGASASGKRNTSAMKPTRSKAMSCVRCHTSSRQNTTCQTIGAQLGPVARQRAQAAVSY